jgi:hypothetical protein
MEINDDQTRKMLLFHVSDRIYGRRHRQEALTKKPQSNWNSTNWTLVEIMSTFYKIGVGRSRSCFKNYCQCNSLKQKL